MKESPIFVKSFETLRWILEHAKKFPKHQRFVMARRVEDAALDFHDCLIRADGRAPDAGQAVRVGCRIVGVS